MKLLATVLRKIHAVRACKGVEYVEALGFMGFCPCTPVFCFQVFGLFDTKRFFRGPLQFSAAPEISRSGRRLNSTVF